jgi:hypothetical protein
MTVANLAIDAVNGDIEKDLDGLIDNVLQLFTSSYGFAIPAFFNAFVASEARSQINELIAQELAKNATCAPPEPLGATFNRQFTVYAFSAASAVFAIFALILFWFVRRPEKGTQLPKNFL